MTKVTKICKLCELLKELIVIGLLAYIIAILLPFSDNQKDINHKIDEIHEYVEDLNENGIDVYINN